ncbi:MAG: DUF1318 domain-containing protein [Candidatus Aenigmatarchaeota archaeon]
MKKLFIFILVILGCAKVSLQTSQPIKVDINMRVDVYQHVVKDVESIEDEIYSSKNKQFNFIFGLKTVYAQDYSFEVSSAIERRKQRISKIEEYFRKGYIGEDKDAYLVILAKDLDDGLKNEIESIIEEENKDRDIIYQATAKKNNVDITEVRKVFFEDHYRRAENGWWFEVYNSKEKIYKWIKK